MAGINVRTLMDHFASMARASFNTESDAHWTDAQILRYLSTAERDFQKIARLGGSVSASTVDMVSGQWAYALPTDLLAGTLERIRLQGAGGGWADLERIRVDRVAQGYAYGSATPPATGDPAKWALDEKNSRILFMPCPNRSATAAFSLAYNPVPQALYRVHQSQDATADVMYGRKHIVLSQGLAVGTILAGDEFGVVPTTQLDGSSVSNLPPYIWHEIDQVVLISGGFLFTEGASFGYATISDSVAKVTDMYLFYTSLYPRVLAEMAWLDVTGDAGTDRRRLLEHMETEIATDESDPINLSTMAAAEEWEVADLDGNTDRLVFLAEGRTATELEEVSDYATRRSNFVDALETDGFFGSIVVDNTIVLSDGSNTDTYHYYRGKGSFLLTGLDVQRVAWQSGTTVRYYLSLTPDLSSVVANDTLWAWSCANTENNGEFLITNVSDAGDYVDVTNPARTDASKDEGSLASATMRLCTTALSGSNLDSVLYQAGTGYTRYTFAAPLPNLAALVVDDVLEVSGSANASNSGSFQIKDKDTVACWLDVANAARTDTSDDETGGSPGYLSTYAGDENSLDVDIVAWQAGTTVRYTFTGSPDLSAVQENDVLEVASCANASNNGSFVVSGVDDTAHYIEVANSDRTDATDDEGAGCPGTGETFSQVFLDADASSLIWESGTTVRVRTEVGYDLSGLASGDKVEIQSATYSDNDGFFAISAVDNVEKTIDFTNALRTDSTKDEEGGTSGSAEAFSTQWTGLAVEYIAWQSGTTVTARTVVPPDLSAVAANDKIVVSSSAHSENDGIFSLTEVDNLTKVLTFTNAARTDDTKDDGANCTGTASIQEGANFLTANPGSSNIGVPIGADAAANKDSFLMVFNWGLGLVPLSRYITISAVKGATTSYFRYCPVGAPNIYVNLGGSLSELTTRTLVAWAAAPPNTTIVAGNALSGMIYGGSSTYLRKVGHLFVPLGYTLTQTLVSGGTHAQEGATNLAAAITASGTITGVTASVTESGYVNIVFGDITGKSLAAVGGSITPTTDLTQKTKIVLREAYSGPTLSAQAFITAQVPDLVTWLNGRLPLDVIPNYALGLLFKDSDQADAARFSQMLRADAEKAVREISQDETGIAQHDAPVTARSTLPRRY